MNIRYMMIMLLMLVLGLVPTSAQKRIYIVSAGIADYPGNDMDLSLCANDAATIQMVFAKATKNDAILFFFSGHGSPGNLVCYDGMLDYQSIKEIMAKSKARSKMIFADACFSGKMRTEQRTQHNTSVPESLRNTEVMFFLSSRSEEVSIERRDMKNGFFTAYLQRGLRGGADANKDRVITALELFRFVSKGVKKISDDKQHPVMWGKFDNNMPVISW